MAHRMTIGRRAWGGALAAAGLFFSTGPAEAQFTSNYEFVNVAGTFNGFETLSPNMTLISNGVWRGYFSLINQTNPAFLFATELFGTTWKQNTQTNFGLPMFATADLNSGSDIVITGVLDGTFAFTLDETSRRYSVQNVTFGFQAGDVWINEFHYDNAGTDVDEGFEIAGQAGVNLTNYIVYLYNGANGQVYDTVNLSGTLPNQQGGFGAVFFARSGIQNGDPDGLVLFRRSPSNVLQLVSYGGSFTGVNGVAIGKNLPDIGVKESAATPLDYSLQLIGVGANVSNFTWSGPSPVSRGALNEGQTIRAGSPPAQVIVSNLVTVPAVPITGQTIHVQANITTINSASNISAVAFYRTDTFSRYQPLAMTLVSGNYYRTSTPIPSQPAGTVIRYYVFVNFAGAGTNSPIVHPPGAPTTVQTVGVALTPPGQVWINEVNAAQDDFFGDEDIEFIELAGLAGANISRWTLEIYNGDVADPSFTVTVPQGTVLVNATNGFGFWVVGDSTVSGINLAFTNGPPTADQLQFNGAIRLLNELGLVEDYVRYGTSSTFTNSIPPGSRYAGLDVGDDPGMSLGLTGTGSNSASFNWSSNAVITAGKINSGQTLTNGNNTPLPPYQVCPSNVFLSCTNDVIPAPNPSSVISTGLCGNFSVTNFFISDTTNTGTGCKGSPRIITRTYGTVSACGTTSTCSQLFVIEDSAAPVLTYPTSTLVNAGFESGSVAGWTVSGNTSGIYGVSTLFPRTGSFHAVIASSAPPTLQDSSGSDFDGDYFTTTRGVTGATPNTATAARFNGSSQYAVLPPFGLAGNEFTIAGWLKRNGAQSSFAGISLARNASTVAGLTFGSANELRYNWGDVAATYNFNSGLVPSNNVWTFFALVITPTNALIYMHDGVQMRAATNVVAHPLVLFDGSTDLARDRGPANRFFAGDLDDIQYYSASLTPGQITTLYNAGLGGVTVPNLIAHYRLDEPALTGGSTFAIAQSLPASPGQAWNASAFAAMHSSDPIRGQNHARVELQFLNSTTNILQAHTSALFTATSATNFYRRLLARGTAPAGTAAARIRLVYQQDADESRGRILYDSALLSTLVVMAGPTNCPVLPDLRSLVSATDACRVVATNQSPAPGTSISGENILVTFSASDQCGQSTQVVVQISVDDTNAPIASVSNVTVSCTNNLPAPSTNAVSASDNCGPVFINLLSETNSAGTGCASSPIVYVRSYQVTDMSGNGVIVTQRVTVVDTNPPAMTVVIPTLLNTNFGTGTGSSANWNIFGNTIGNVAVSNFTPRTPGGHFKVFGQFTNDWNFSGFYQDLPTSSSLYWRASAWIYLATNDAIAGNNSFEIKIEFYSNTYGGAIGEYKAPIITSNSPVGVYFPVSVTATTPLEAAWVRFVGVFVQPPGMAGGSVYVDDVNLSPRHVSTLPTSGIGLMPPITNLAVPTDCSYVLVTQNVAVGSSVLVGANNRTLFGRDECGNVRSTNVVVIAVDDTPPTFTNLPPDLDLLSTNDVPAPDLSQVQGSDNVTAAGSLSKAHQRDVWYGGTGASGSPLFIRRYYVLWDAATNPAVASQLIRVEAAANPPPTNVVVQTISIAGTNVTVRSLGTNTWLVIPEYATNLLGPQNWFPITNTGNTFLNGTNTTTFGLPTNAPPVFIRIQQTLP